MTVSAPPSDLAPRLAGLTLAEIEVPNGREEEWRFTPLKRLAGLHELNSTPASVSFSVDAPAGVEVSELVSEVSFPAADRIAAAAATLSESTLTISIPREAVIDQPLLVRIAGGSEPSVGRFEVHAGKYSQTQVLLDHTGSGAQAVAGQFFVEDGAQLTIVSVHDGDRTHVLGGQHAISLGRDSKVTHVAVTLGGDVVRMVTTVEYTLPGGDAILSGAFFTDAGQHHEHRLFVDHALPHCRSDVMYKGVLQGQDAHSVWIGDVLIRGNAVGTSTYEINRNLILTDGARADSVPNLEIETGEIEGAGHASTTGRFDEEQIFYLTSRGIPLVEAKRLVVRGFLVEIIDRIPVEDVRARLLAGVESRLGESSALFGEDDND
ncbi:MAG: hypothetical protein RL441_340 [Actinomycetota bacterium]